jgi:hypothetical protein
MNPTLALTQQSFAAPPVEDKAKHEKKAWLSPNVRDALLMFIAGAGTGVGILYFWGLINIDRPNLSNIDIDTAVKIGAQIGEAISDESNSPQFKEFEFLFDEALKHFVSKKKFVERSDGAYKLSYLPIVGR